MYYKEHEISNRKIVSMLGKPVKDRVKGSGLFFVKYFKIFSDVVVPSLRDFKGIFELYDSGVLLRTFKSDKRIYIPIASEEIEWVKIHKGQEIINPFPLFPMWMLMKLGVSVEIARYFSIYSEYRIDETIVEIKTDRFQMRLGSNGYSFNGQEKFFLRLRLKDKLQIIKPSPADEK